MFSPEQLIEGKDSRKPSYPSIPPKLVKPTCSEEENNCIKSTLDSIEKALFSPTISILKHLSKAIWDDQLRKAEVTEKVGNYWKFMGHSINKKTYLNPEEALYLIETGNIELTYCNLPMSVQRAYAVFMKSGLSLNNYRVYADLVKNGYRVFRHRHALKNQEDKDEIPEKKIKLEKLQEDLNFVLPGRLDLSNNNNSPAQFIFDIYKSKKSIMKSALGVPDFRICVSAHSDKVPTASEICRLQSLYDDQVPIIYAVVYSDFIGYYQLALMELTKLT